MTKRFKKLTAMVLALCAMLTASPLGFAGTDKAPEPAYFDLPVNKTRVRVGLCFENSAVSKAELTLNENESFILGYFDYERQFHKLADIRQESVHVLSSDGDEAYTDSELNTRHILMPDEFEDYSDAVKLCRTLKDSFPGYIDGKFRALTGVYESEDEAQEDMRSRGLDAEVFCADENTFLVADKEEETPMFLVSSNVSPAFKPKISSSAIEFNGNTYRGALSCHKTEGAFNVINYVELEDYVKGVLPYEMVAKWPMDALKSQAVCARTYVYNNIDAYAQLGFDLRNDTYSQVYKGLTGSTPATDEAAKLTKGSFVRYRGALCRIYYMSADGGATDSGENVFSKRRAYLAPVNDDNEEELDYYNKSWKTVLSSETVLRRLKNAGFELKNISDIKADKSQLGIVTAITVTDSKKNSVTLYGEECFLVLGLNSLNYDVHSKEKGLWTFEGHGWGHNCGMSQWGAYGMAELKGASAEDIISFYFSGAYIR